MAAQVPSGAPQFGWRCDSLFAIDGAPVTMWRDFGLKSVPPTYFIQTHGDSSTATYWRIDGRPEGPPPKATRTWDAGRSEAAVLRDGPDYVSIAFAWRTQVVGPVYAYFWGDGRYAGALLLYSARQVRRATERDGTMGGVSGGLALGEISRKLYGARAWQFRVVDASGKVLTNGSVRPPDLARSVAVYRAERDKLERLESRFRTDFVDRTEGTTTCAAHEDPAAAI